MSGAPSDAPDHGFALIEVLVAFAIVSLCLASLYTAIAGNTRQTAIIDMHRQTLAYAQSHLEAFSEAVGARSTQLEGSYPNGTKWQVELSSIAYLDTGGAAVAVRPFLVVLQVFDRTGRRVVTLDSIKMMAADK